MSAIAAFFDVDNTLLMDHSGKLYAQWMFRHGRLTRYDLAKTAYALLLHRLGRLDARALLNKSLEQFVGYPVAQIHEEGREWFRAMVIPKISPQGLAAVRAHQAAGHKVLLLSAATQYICDPLAAHLEIDGALCVRIIERNGKLTNRIQEPFCYGPGKLENVEAYAAAEGIDLVQSYFYSDSVTDLPVLEAVGHPVAVNADRALASEARLRAWPIRQWKISRGIRAEYLDF